MQVPVAQREAIDGLHGEETSSAQRRLHAMKHVAEVIARGAPFAEHELGVDLVQFCALAVKHLFLVGCDAATAAVYTGAMKEENMHKKYLNGKSDGGGGMYSGTSVNLPSTTSRDLDTSRAPQSVHAHSQNNSVVRDVEFRDDSFGCMAMRGMGAVSTCNPACNRRQPPKIARILQER